MEKATILIIDEDEAHLNEYVRKLQKLNYKVVVLDNPSLALDTFESEEPQLILLEWNLKEKDGFDFLTELRAHTDYKDIPVIVFSGSPTKEAVEKSIMLGVKDFIVKKQVTLAELSERIKQHLATFSGNLTEEPDPMS